MPRPFWSGHIQISLVSFAVKLFPATEAKGEIHFHQISRKTGERVHHQKVSGDEGPVEKDAIVKGYEYRKGEYVTIEPSDIENIRIPSRKNLEVTQFVDLTDLDPELFEKPYFVVPDGDQQAEAFAVVRKALQETGKAALGKIAFSGREHVIAISAPPEAKEDGPETRGMMAYTLRYADELRKPADYFSEIKKTTVDEDQLSLAKELIKRKAAKYDPSKFVDQYEMALKQMVEDKVNKVPAAKDEPAAPRSGKVVNLMDALRRSVEPDKAEKAPAAKAEAPAKKKAAKVPAAESAGGGSAKGISLVEDEAKAAKAARPRKSA